MKTIATIEARMGSSRLPGKMAMELAPGLSALEAVIERLGFCCHLDGIVLATSIASQDVPLCRLAERRGAAYEKGSEDHVLERVTLAAQKHQAQCVVLVTGDCSCLSYSLIDEALVFFKHNDYDFLSNAIHLSYPIGVDVQIVRFDVLADAYHRVMSMPNPPSEHLEHVNHFIRMHPERYRIYDYQKPEAHRFDTLKLALDTPDDLALIRSVYAELYAQNPRFDLCDIYALFERKPQLIEGLLSHDYQRAGY